MKANETRADYVKRCMIHAQDVVEKSPITKVPDRCVTDESASCYPSSPCDEGDEDCIEFGGAFKIEAGESVLIDPCSKDELGYSQQLDISELPEYLAGIEAERPAAVKAPGRKARRS